MRLWAYLENAFLAWDEALNATFGGDRDESVSSRVGRCALNRLRLAQVVEPFIDLFAFVFFLELRWWHCRRHIELENVPPAQLAAVVAWQERLA